jgi:hypothetical protein
MSSFSDAVKEVHGHDAYERWGRKGGKARNPKKGNGAFPPTERSARARKAALARWAKSKQGNTDE